MTEVVVTTGAIGHAKLQSNHHHQQTNIQFFTGRMPLLLPNQQCQSTEGKISHSMDLLTPSSPGGLPTLSLTTNSSWLPWGRVAMPLISPLMPVPPESVSGLHNSTWAISRRLLQDLWQTQLNVLVIQLNKTMSVNSCPVRFILAFCVRCPWLGDTKDIKHVKAPRCCACNDDLMEANCRWFARVLEPCAGSGVVRIDPLHFLAACRTRRLNQI